MRRPTQVFARRMCVPVLGAVAVLLMSAQVNAQPLCERSRVSAGCAYFSCTWHGKCRSGNAIVNGCLRYSCRVYQRELRRSRPGLAPAPTPGIRTTPPTINPLPRPRIGPSGRYDRR